MFDPIFHVFTKFEFLRRFFAYKDGILILIFDFCLGIISKVKEGAENVQTKIQAKAESMGIKPIFSDNKGRILLTFR